MVLCCGLTCKDPTKIRPKQFKTSYTVSYDSSNHFSVLTQVWGSKWLSVLPFCLFNVMVMIILITVRDYSGQKYSIKMSTQGHTFITLVVSFLLVSRVNMALARYNEARNALGIMYRETRELIHNLCVMSADDQEESAKQWRSEVSYRCLMLLRTAMAVVDYPTSGVPAWDVPELNGVERQDVNGARLTDSRNNRYAHGQRSLWEETMRVPIRMAYLLRKSIYSNRRRVSPDVLCITQEHKMFADVDAFMVGYYGIRKFLTTPVPFPLIQMARTFLFLYVFTIPFVMLGDESCDLAHCCVVFLITYGFFGLEIVAIELDNPFGDDANDFDVSCRMFAASLGIFLT